MLTLLLAAGQSKRLKPIEDKNLLKFLGKTLIAHQVQALTKNGFTNILIIANKTNLPQIKSLKLPAQLIEQKDLKSGMKGALLAAEKIIQNQKILVVSGNDLVEEKVYANLQKEIKKAPQIGHLIAKKISSYFPGGYLKLDPHNYLRGIVEKPSPGATPSDVINLVIHFHPYPQKLLTILKETVSAHDDLYEIALSRLFRETKYRALVYGGVWLPIKYPWHILRVTEFFLKTIKHQISPQAEIASSAIIKGPVHISANARIFDHATIVGPAYIGENCIIANNSLVRESIINNHSVVGFGSEVARSYLGSNVWLHHNYVGDSVFDDNVALGFGAVTGNFRLDQENIAVEISGETISTDRQKLGAFIGRGVRIGINCGIMPGKKIGAGSIIGAHTNVHQNIPPFSTVYTHTPLLISKSKK